MFRLSRLPANSTIANKWKVGCGSSVLGNGGVSVSSQIDSIKDMFPPELIDNELMYIAFAISLITSLPLFLSSKVLTVSIAQLGVATSIVFIACSMHGVFGEGYFKVFIAAIIILIIVLFITFFDGIEDALRQKSWSDLILRGTIVLIFLSIHIYALNKVWSYQ